MSLSFKIELRFNLNHRGPRQGPEAVGGPAGVGTGGGQALLALGVVEHAPAGIDE